MLDSKNIEYLKKVVDESVFKSNNIDFKSFAVPIGNISSNSSAVLPPNYLLCDGATLVISDYQELFNIIGNTNNKPNTDSSLYFDLPDLNHNKSKTQNIMYSNFVGVLLIIFYLIILIINWVIKYL